MSKGEKDRLPRYRVEMMSVMRREEGGKEEGCQCVVYQIFGLHSWTWHPVFVGNLPLVYDTREAATRVCAWLNDPKGTESEWNPESEGAYYVEGTEARVCDDIARRQRRGIQKYGFTVEGNPLPLISWLRHAYEECLDQAVYLRRAIEEIENQNATGSPTTGGQP